MKRPRLDLPCGAPRQFGHREILDMVPRAQEQLALFQSEGLSRAQWHALVGRPPAIERDDDITTLVIAMLEERWEAMPLKPPAPSRRVAPKRRMKERA